MTVTVAIGWIVVLLVLSGFFSASEIAYASANKLRLKRNAESGSLRDRTAFYIYDHYQDALTTILIGNNLVNIAASSLAAAVIMGLFGEKAVAYSAGAMTVLILIFGEIFPKIVAKEHADGYAMGVALPLRLLMWITKPFVWLVNIMLGWVSRLWTKNAGDEPTVTEEELASIIETADDEGVIDADRSELLQSALEFSEISAQEILTPRVDMLAIDIDDPLDEIIEEVINSPYSRIPVYEDGVDNVIGILFQSHLLKKLVDTPDTSSIMLRDMLMEACFIHKTMKLPAVLEELKRRQTHIAIVTDEYGGTMGVVTMEDVLEQLVGEIWDESDEIVDMIRSTGENTYYVSGDMNVFDFFEELELDDRELDDEYTSIGGWATDMLGGIPSEGDSFDYENITVSVAEMDEQRVVGLNVTVRPKPEKDDEL